jgi:hypothetical protein
MMRKRIDTDFTAISNSRNVYEAWIDGKAVR